MPRVTMSWMRKGTSFKGGNLAALIASSHTIRPGTMPSSLASYASTRTTIRITTPSRRGIHTPHRTAAQIRQRTPVVGGTVGRIYRIRRDEQRSEQDRWVQ